MARYRPLPQGRGDVFRLGLHLCRGVTHDQGVSHTRQHFQVVGTVADGVAVGQVRAQGLGHGPAAGRLE